MDSFVIQIRLTTGGERRVSYGGVDSMEAIRVLLPVLDHTLSMKARVVNPAPPELFAVSQVCLTLSFFGVSRSVFLCFLRTRHGY